MKRLVTLLILVGIFIHAVSISTIFFDDSDALGEAVGKVKLTVLGICGNGNVELGEDCEPPNTSTCDASCQSIAPTPPTGGGGGPGKPPGPGDCDEDWVCDNWVPEICPLSALQQRECVDLNNCGTFEERPEILRDCVPGEVVLPRVELRPPELEQPEKVVVNIPNVKIFGMDIPVANLFVIVTILALLILGLMKLIPLLAYKSIDYLIGVTHKSALPKAKRLAKLLDDKGHKVKIHLKVRKHGDHKKHALRVNAKRMIILGQEHASGGHFPVHHVKTGKKFMKHVKHFKRHKYDVRRAFQ